MDPKTALYTELWRACAGPLVTMPREGERVFYFPQGHIEQGASLDLRNIYLHDSKKNGLMFMNSDKFSDFQIKFASEEPCW
ncbi:unnamed protein product [Camellia sinensis]